MIQNDKPIAILLANYNGEKYIREQLESLYAQTYKDWTLYVRDDCSTDTAMDIVKSYAEKYPNIVVIDNKGKNLGAQNNFMTLLQEVESSYYMFMDNDDYWLPHKVKNEYRKIQEIEHEAKPALIFTNLKLADKGLNIMHESFWKCIHFRPEVFCSLKDQAFIGYVTGCTMMFNHRAKEISFPVASYSPMHDWWVAINVYKHHGDIGYIEEPQILYRKHGDNATGNFVSSQKGKSLLQRWNELVQQYQLLKACGCVTGPCDYLISKRKINKKRKHY